LRASAISASRAPRARRTRQAFVGDPIDLRRPTRIRVSVPPTPGPSNRIICSAEEGPRVIANALGPVLQVVSRLGVLDELRGHGPIHVAAEIVDR
jgi:hypothetical protein